MRLDTIAAPATPPGEGGIAIVRVSGPEARAAAGAIFSRRLRDHRAVLGLIREPASGEVVDEAMALLMAAPRSFTREDVVELHCHGGRVTTARVMGLLLGQGVRAAEPGEFTLRAFLNGRIDLAQAEAVLDVIRARTDAAQRVAVLGLAGRVGAAARAVREELIGALAYLVARIDFPEEDVPAGDIEPALAAATEALSGLIAGAARGRLLREGARVVLVGPPNAGKSSLLNRLLGADRAIVTPVAGTTRDTLEEAANIGGIPVVLVDTAGLSAAPDAIEALGIERTHEAVAQADAALLVLDGAAPPPASDALVALAEGRPALAVLNKADLAPAFSPAALPVPAVRVSARTGAGVALLEQRLAELLGNVATGEAETLVSNPRHLDALRRSLEAVESARAGLAAALPEDFIGIDLRAALDALGEITGETAGEVLLDAIFSRFCIGK